MAHRGGTDSGDPTTGGLGERKHSAVGGRVGCSARSFAASVIDLRSVQSKLKQLVQSGTYWAKRTNWSKMGPFVADSYYKSGYYKWSTNQLDHFGRSSIKVVRGRYTAGAQTVVTPDI